MPLLGSRKWLAASLPVIIQAIVQQCGFNGQSAESSICGGQLVTVWSV